MKPGGCPERHDMIARLIAQDTVTSRGRAELDHSNRPVIDLIAEWAEGLGFSVQVLPVPERPGKSNLIASLGRGPGGLVLAGHADTVPCDPDRWSMDPFTATERGGRLYGLGACDMKSFLALALEAGGRYTQTRLTKPLHLVVTADEETDMSGARALASANALQADAAVVGEPTNLRPIRMHKGIIMERVQLVGQSGHSSDPAYGNSALEGAYEALSALRSLRAELQAEFYDGSFRVPVPTLNLGQIRGGDNPNRICGECEIAYDVRLLPGMDASAIRDRVRARLTAALAGSGLELHFEALSDGTPAAATPANALIVQAAEELTGHPAGAVAFGTEAGYYQRQGMDVVVLGPGSIAQAHQPDEYVPLDQLDRTVELLDALIERFCLQRPHAVEQAV
ncbi:MAG: acetylornithine deacetylase [Halofilum sp. (in: g-proteobacteria)]